MATTLFLVRHGEVENPDLNYYALSHVASEVAWDAVLSCYAL